MSEEILKALMQLFAIITKQDEGVTANEKEYVRYFLQSQLSEEQVDVYHRLYDKYYKEEIKPAESESTVVKKKAPVDLDKLKSHPLLSMQEADMDEDQKKKLARLKKKIRKEEARRKDQGENSESGSRISVFDSVMTLSICQKINQTLSQPQKLIVFARLLELLKADNKFTEERMQVLQTVAKVFNISETEYNSMYAFVLNDFIFQYDDPNLLVVDGEEYNEGDAYKHIATENLHKSILILRVQSVGLYFMRYVGKSELNYNGLLVDKRRLYLFAPGSTIRLPKDKPVYYSEVVSKYLSDSSYSKVSYDVDGLWYRFPNGNVGLRDVNLSEEHGKLVGIMGASGAGKTTLLNVLCGIESPSEGSVKINGIDIHSEPEKVEGVIGYIPQDDLLLEDLTVYQNLFYNAKLCFADKSEEELDAMVMETLHNLGLVVAKDLKVGNPLQKTISGGQRKRLNIGLELIRESSVLFVDEPTSGLSSRDSENVMDLLRELALKGKVIFVVIHQPSSDIYKMFDKIFILDTGGYPIYYGNPVEAVTYFKKADHQVNADEGECSKCGNVDVELIFNIIESQVVNEYGEYTGHRKMSPTKWNESYLKELPMGRVEVQDDPVKSSLNLPSKLGQWLIFTTRDVLSKLANEQYMAINILEAPLLAMILSFTIRYVDEADGLYSYGKNENIPAFLFICIIVALFMGLTVSAEEIVKDQRILKRESFLNLSKGSYFMSKVGILFTVSAFQTLLFVLIGNSVLGISGMTMSTWFILFTVSCFANMLGLNISASFNSAITIYILIPIILIPQMIFSGAMFNFEKLNDWMGNEVKVPLIADMMPSRWAFEAYAVKQFTDNDFEKQFYPFEKIESTADFKKVYYLPELRERLEYVMKYVGVMDPMSIQKVETHLANIKSGLNRLNESTTLIYEKVDNLDYMKVTTADFIYIKSHLKRLRDSDQNLINSILNSIEGAEPYILYDLPERRGQIDGRLKVLRTEIEKQMKELPNIPFNGKTSDIKIASVNQEVLVEIDSYLKAIRKEYSELFSLSHNKLNTIKFELQETPGLKKKYKKDRDNYFNFELAALVKKKKATKKIKQIGDELIQLGDPIYKVPMHPENLLDYRSHFFAPKKHFLGMYFDTFYFNICVIWFASIFLYITLYFGIFKRLLDISTLAIQFIVDQIRIGLRYFLAALYRRNEI